MRLRAFAKINLDLTVLGKRPDGFHEIRTTFQTIDWCDEIHIEPSTHFEFSATDGPQDESNLVVRAVRVFERACGHAANVRIELIKHVPAGAGLGGGSADAAVTFMGLGHLYGYRHLDPAVLEALGSDVPFFTIGGRALGTGRGEKVEALDDDTGYWLLLADAGLHVATREAYSWIAADSPLTLIDKSNSIEGFRVPPVPNSDAAAPGNDFEAPVFSRYPRLHEIKQELLRLGAFRAAMSGSGSVVYGQFRTRLEAEKVSTELPSKCSVKLTKPLSRAEYFSQMFCE